MKRLNARRAFRSVLVLPAITLGAAVLCTGWAGSRQADPATVDVPAQSCPDVSVTETPITPSLNGAPIDTSVSDPAILRSFSGISVTQTIPPSDWDPLTATDQELTFYGIPARPTNPDGLTIWISEWSHFSTLRITPCAAGPSALSQTMDGGNWAGVEDNGHTDYNNLHAQLALPIASQGSCATMNSYSAWVGLGGSTNGAGLLQNGIIASNLVPTNARGPNGEIGAFYEQLHGNADTGPVWSTPGFVSPGDAVSIWMTYHATGSVSYTWHDITNSTYVEADVAVGAGYYSGTTADFIDEDNTTYYDANGIPHYSGIDVRDYGVVGWTNLNASRANGTNQDAGAWPHIDEHSTGFYGHTTQDLFNGKMLSNTAFDMDWAHCN